MDGKNPRLKPNILIAISSYNHRTHRGIVRYAREASWRLKVQLSPGGQVPWGWQGDGIIAGVSSKAVEFRKFLEAAPMPVVDTDWRQPELQVPRVLIDNTAIGTQAAEHFLAKGFRDFVFLAGSNDWNSRERGHAFNQRLAASGHHSDFFDFKRQEHETWLDRQQRLERFLSERVGPVAVFCVYDMQAIDVIEACLAAGLTIPDRVAVLSVGNDDLICDTATIGLSSIDTNQEVHGYQVAAHLDRLMRGESLPLEPIRVPAGSVVTRTSTDIMAVGNSSVVHAVRFLHEHFTESIGVADVASAVHMTRQGLTKAFATHLGRSPGEELRRIRIEAAKQALIDGESKLDVIARQIGYSSANSLCLAFKRETGLTPIGFRKKHTKQAVR